jgi:gamma-glutamylcyclotransferase (GGCT)/AIG2-like uncharacterized protein YtfP
MKKEWGATKLTYDIHNKVKGIIMPEHIVFVYGTLKRGFHNHYILGESEFIGTAWTSNNYYLYDGAFPYVTDEGDQWVLGELYCVRDETIMKNIDRLEGVPHHYVRHDVIVHEADVSWPDKWIDRTVNGANLRATMYIASEETRSYIVAAGRVPASGQEVAWPPSLIRPEEQNDLDLNDAEWMERGADLDVN